MLLKGILLIAALYVVWSLIRGDMRHRKERSANKERELIDAGKLVKDPVCGTYVAAQSSISVRDGTAEHHFCSYECRDRFLRQLGKEPPHDDEA
jgi:YHS domain-containing protein